VTALVTGSTGFLGTALVERLLARPGADLRCLVRQASDTSRLSALAARHPEAKVTRVVGSLGSADDAAKVVEGCDVIYHLAAAMGGAPADLFLNTVVSTKHLFDAIVRTSRPGSRPTVVLVSSFGVYGVAELGRGALVDESTPLEPHPERRDPYSQAKLRQERLCWSYHEREGIPLVVARPGVIYGPRGSAFSGRVGLNLFGLFLHLGGRNKLPLTYVDNCAEAIAVVGEKSGTAGQAYNVVDDDLIDCSTYLRRYKKNVKALPSISLPYPLTVALSHAVARYHKTSQGQLPAVFTPYKTATSWKGNNFTNAKLKALGWQPLVSTDEGLRRTFDYLKAQAA
jgi:nucleoside-diphosphate-sugar epimerase